MPIRKQRAPRPGEIMSWLAGRVAVKAEEGSGRCGGAPQARFAPAPCCGQTKRGGSAIINTKTGLWKCFRCQRVGNWLGLTALFGTPLKDAYEADRPVDFGAYDRVRAARRRPVTLEHYPALLALCASRGFRKETLDAWKVSTKGGEHLRWPIYARDDAGAWVVVNARVRLVVDRDRERTGKDGASLPADWFEVRGGPTFLAIGNHLLGQIPPQSAQTEPLWLEDWLTHSGEGGDPLGRVRRVLIVEGQWDAMVAYQLGIPNVLSCANGASAVDVGGLLRYVPEGAEVWVASDMDEAGDKMAEAVFSQVGPDRVRRLRLPHKDLNAWLMAEPTLTAEQVLRTALAPGETEDRAAGWLDLMAVSEAPRLADGIVCPTPWGRLSERLGGGWHEGQTSGILAPSGIGKTTIANNVVAEAVRTIKVGVIQLEGTRQAVTRALRAQVAGWINPDMEEMLPPFLAKIRVSGLEGKGVTWRQTIEEAKKMADEGAKLIVIDNWDYIIPPSPAGSGEKMRAYAAFQELCRRAGVHGLVVWQPNKVDRGDVVNSGQQKGLSNALQDADVYLTLNKFGLVRRIDVEKARGIAEREGMASQVWLKFDPDRHNLYETDSQAVLTPSSRL